MRPVCVGVVIGTLLASPEGVFAQEQTLPAVRVVAPIQTGTSTLTPKELADGWEAAATAAGNLNHVRNNITSNENLTTIMFLSTRTSPEQKVEMDARRGPGEKITRVEISSPLPKPEEASE